MTLALSLGMTMGVRRTLWMIAGELVGVAVVALATLAGVATIMLAYPEIFVIFKLVGGAYLAFLGIQLWQSKGAMAITQETSRPDLMKRTQLATQDFVTAIANPKGWALFVALLPPYYRLPTTNHRPDHYSAIHDVNHRVYLSNRLRIRGSTAKRFSKEPIERQSNQSNRGLTHNWRCHLVGS